MSPTSTALTVKAQNGSPYQLNHEQTLKASKALLTHIKSSDKEKTNAADKKSLIKDNSDSEEDQDSSEPIWLLLTTKKHLVDKKRLKPSKISLPHPLNTSETSTICLITADPQRTYKDLVASPAFPTALSKRITKVVGVKKIQKKWTQYEAQRKLFAEHDVFLADDRIITRLPQLLGKTFYGNTKKRPIPVSIQAAPAKTEEKKIAKAKGQGSNGPAEPKAVAAAIEKSMQCAILNLNSSTHTPIIVGYAHWSAEKLAENIVAVVEVLVEKYVPKKWRGVKAFHVKGAATAALPIWLADEMWVDEADVIGEEELKSIEETKVNKKRKGRALEGGAVDGSPKEKKQKLLESNDDKLDEEIKARKEKLKLQKLEAMMDEDADSFIPKASKKSKKSKAVSV
ncbi:ribosomal protein L1 [Stipitochalara longipes BDJ]|nr:ribosomal protein L1 [Stipitochalara longipes BDJ]